MAGGLFSRFAPLIRELPSGSLTPADLLNDRFLLISEGRVSIYYAPFEHMRRTARIVLVGITAGIHADGHRVSDGARRSPSGSLLRRDI